ncbi:O-antigen ligase [Curtobacterium sp. MCBD17_008]|uniref:O-antigen ligase family protein n=1 Tax=Curtobacterium sp. MCBD17_008 TaxID=2175656 RepID=UPI000DA95FCD|nr:O-antigen ligase family protein [Curtobacterium sp. MCBD17_008]PZE90456.1 hypothetical protein DEI95_11910 [Curtobacterium sp. MCBD17_008]
MRRILVVGAGVVLTTLAAGLIVRQPSVAPLTVAALVAVLVLVIRPAWSIYLTLIFAFTALPAAIPTEFEVAGSSIRVHEPFLVLALVYSVAHFRASRRANLLAGAFAAFVAVGLLVAFASQNPVSKIIFDARPVVECAAVIFIAVRLYGTKIARRCIVVFTWILWVSAVIVFAGATLGVSVGGRTEEADLANPDAVSGAATRLLTSATFPALAVLCAITALVVAGKMPLRSSWVLGVPALVIVILSFSRNSILALGVAVLFAALMSRTVSSTTRAVGIGLTTVAVFGLLVVMNPILAGLPGGEFINTQVASYASRVIDGLNSNVQASDISVQFRVSEDGWLLQGLSTSPIFGHGFGFAYKPSAGRSSFTLDYAPYYAHNFYLWTAVKSGLLGGVLMLVSVVGPLWRAVRKPSFSTIAIASALAGMLGSSFVAPVALSATSSVLFGVLVGAVIAATEGSKGSTGQAPEKPRAEGRPVAPSRPPSRFFDCPEECALT